MDIFDPVGKIPFVGPKYQKRLEKLQIFTIEDLLLHIPSRYIDYSLISSIKNIQPGEILTIKAKVNFIKNIYTKKGRKMQVAEVEDKSGKINVLWFNQPFLVRSFKKNEQYSFSGKSDWFDRKITLISPDYEPIATNYRPLHTGRLVPVYPETYGISSKWLRNRISFAINTLSESIFEYLDESILNKYHLEDLKKSLLDIHYPKKITDIKTAKYRLAFNEVLFLHLSNIRRKNKWKRFISTHCLNVSDDIISQFINSLAFKLTSSQLSSIREIYIDIKKNYPMNRLLEGDVGSGKTVVAAAACFASFVNGYQSIIMAPTQILAEQHYITLKSIFDPFKARLSLITSTTKKSDLGKVDIFIGTHALIHKKASFDDVAFVAIDEQHRFGVEQRSHLIKKSGKNYKAPHVLTMTATPIPRTIALTLYGDLSLSTLKELPKGRKPIVTWLVPNEKRQNAYLWIINQMKKQNVQLYIICPLIEESEIETMKQIKAATKEYEKIRNLFKEFNVGLLHGKMKGEDKNNVLNDFKKGVVDILVATPVVEVGIDVPNAAIMIIEAAERFGLSQLHQLRGRIGRGKKKSYCMLFTQTNSKSAIARLHALMKSHSGFELAELDLQLRGPGEIFGLRQHGVPELKIATWNDVDLIKASKEAAENILSNKKLLDMVDHYLIKKGVALN